MARQIVVEIIGDNKQFKNTLDNTEGRTKSFGSKLGGYLKVGALAFAGVSTAAVGAGSVIFDLGSQYEAMDNKAKTVFKDSLKDVQNWAATNAQAMGLTKREATGLAAGMGDLLIPMGFTTDQAAKMSTETVGLAGALSEWSGGQKSAAEVSDILTKAMLGEREGLKSLGISISEADVQAQLLKNGTADLTGAQLEQARATATQELIFAKSKDAQEAYNDGSAKGIRTQAELTAQFNEAKETLITKLYPIVTKVAQFLARNLPAAIKAAGDIFNWLSKNVVPQVVSGVKTVIGIVQTVAGVMVTVRGVFKAVWAAIGGYVSTAVSSIRGFIANLRRIFDSVKTTINGVREGIRSALNNVISFLGGLPGRVGRAVSGMWDSIKTGFKNVVNTVIRWWNGLGFKVPTIDLGPLGKFGGFNIGTPNIPYLHAGGIVPGIPGSDVPAILQAGERVIPMKDANRGGGITINIESFVGSDHDIEKFADRIALRMRLAGA